MRVPALPTSLLIGAVLQTRTSTAIDNDFSAYPQGSQQCLSDSADQSKCSGSTGQELNECLCTNKGNFIYSTAECVARQSPNDLDAVYDTMQNNCAGTGVTIAVSKDAFMSQARAATTSSSATPSETSSSSSTSTSISTTSSPTATSQPNTDDDNNDNDSGMPTSTKIGLGVGVSFGAIALGLLAWFVYAYSRRRRTQDPASSSSPSPYPSTTFPSSPFPPSTIGMNRDVELSHNYATTPKSFATTTAATSPWSPAMTATEYAQHNGQFERAELDPDANRGWKEMPSGAAGYYGDGGSSEGEGGGGLKHSKRASSVPLLAELGVENSPGLVELPGDNTLYGDGDGDEREGRRKRLGLGDGGAG